ncbi:MAG: hypothetical protein HWD58_09665 [Bacteroidota bacterium]|nr:MAG: hypothetical protein HWD58_09665 [Bacteroidota bacterium]
MALRVPPNFGPAFGSEQPTRPFADIKNEGQFILAPNVNVAVYKLFIQNPNTTNITYFDPGVVKPTWWTINNPNYIDYSSASTCYYTPSSPRN